VFIKLKHGKNPEGRALPRRVSRLHVRQAGKAYQKKFQIALRCCLTKFALTNVEEKLLEKGSCHAAVLISTWVVAD
jgi:hypothetical protein